MNKIISHRRNLGVEELHTLDYSREDSDTSRLASMH